MFKRLSILISLTLLLVLASEASPGTIASDPLSLDDGMTGDVNAVLTWSPGDYAAWVEKKGEALYGFQTRVFKGEVLCAGD